MIQAIEHGVATNGEMPWRTSNCFQHPINVATGQRYQGINILSLWAVAEYHSYPEAIWGTYLQWQQAGRQVAAGQRSTLGVFWKKIDEASSDDDHEDGDDSRNGQKTRRIAKAFGLFNVAQLVGYEPPPEPPLPPEHQRVENAEVFFAALGADIRHGGNRAFYRSTSDHIQMPPFASFIDPLNYYSVLSHEATHWSGAPSRLARDLKGRFGTESYAFEELVAELGAAFIAADLGLSPNARPENASYIDNWLKVLKSDKHAIFTASRLAQEAVDYLHGKQPAPVPILHRAAAVPSLSM